jgi:tetratricopeptide (TPR) repeat protein
MTTVSHIYYKLFVIVLFIASQVTSIYGLNRDYCIFVEDSDGIVYCDDLKYLDEYRDQEAIYYYEYCVDHFNISYLPCKFSLEECLPKIERSLLYLIPQFQIYNKKSDNEWVCYYRLNLQNLCSKPAIYAGYLDYDFHVYDFFLEEQLVHTKNSPSCKCYWPELSKESGRINDFAYLLFRELLENTALKKLIDNIQEQQYLLKNAFWELNLHGLSISCVARSFWFSHYYRLCLHLLEYTLEDFDAHFMTHSQVALICSKIKIILAQLANEFRPLYEECLKNHPSPEIENEYEFLKLLYPESTDYISASIASNLAIEIADLQKDFDSKSSSPQNRVIGNPIHLNFNEPFIRKENYINSHKFFAEFYLYQGLYLNDVLDFENAIKKLDIALKYDNRNKLAYLARAYANFELKNFNIALDDYANAKNFDITPPLLLDRSLNFFNQQCSVFTPKNRIEFSKGFILGGMQGFNESARNFIPSILHTITGIGQGLWVFAKNPRYVSQEFMEIAGIYLSLAKEYLDDADFEDMIPEIDNLLRRWAVLTDFEKGRQLGFAIGKYGIDMFLTGKTIQLARQFREVKYANATLTFDACQDAKLCETIHKEARSRSLFRSSLFKDGKIKLNKGKQKNHIPGPDFKDGRSPITISLEKLEKLCEEKAGTGQTVFGKMGQPGYKERINFGEYIGECRYEIEKGVWVQEPTTVGILHYDAEGTFHVIPARPKYE